uniref:Uncharacterized protein n=1 Tax=Anguilla anguilla TaxID=7936 RepID=A0A0E9TP03_ANGAN
MMAREGETYINKMKLISWCFKDYNERVELSKDLFFYVSKITIRNAVYG